MSAIDETLVKFDWVEYSVCAAVMSLSAMIGIYYGCFSEQATVNEYMLGGKKMGIFPIAMSLIASHASCVLVLGVPVEIFNFGAQFLLATVSAFGAMFIIIVAYLPVFYKLQLISCNEYLELRFNSIVRKMASLMFVTFLLLQVPIIIFTVAMALEEVSGINMFVIAPVVSAVCIFYTTMGGLKAVVWTDTLQSFFTMATVFVMSLIGTNKAGGFQKVIQINKDGGIFDLNFSTSPYERITVWNALVGQLFGILAYLGTHAGSVQRFVSLPTIRDAKWAVFFMAVGVTFVFVICGYIGIVLFAIYHDCNPLTTKRIIRADQLLPYLIMHVGGYVKGLPGFFIAGIFSAALGSMSAALNTLAGIIFEDFVSQWLPKDTSDRKSANIIKLLVVFLGIISVILVFVVNMLKGIVQIAISVTGLSTGAGLGLFTLGMFFPMVNTKGAIWGGITSFVFMAWIVIGSQLKFMTKELSYKPLPTSIDNCPYNVTNIVPDIEDPNHNEEDVFFLFRISFMWFVTLGCFIVIFVGFLVSYFSGGNKVKDVNPELISPVVRKFFYKKESTLNKEMYEIVKTSEKLADMQEKQISQRT